MGGKNEESKVVSLDLAAWYGQFDVVEIHPDLGVYNFAGCGRRVTCDPSHNRPTVSLMVQCIGYINGSHRFRIPWWLMALHVAASDDE